MLELAASTLPSLLPSTIQERAALAGGMRLEEGDRGVRLEEAQQGAATLPARWLGRIWDWLLSPGGTGEGETGEGKGGKEGGEEGGTQKQDAAIIVQVTPALTLAPALAPALASAPAPDSPPPHRWPHLNLTPPPPHPLHIPFTPSRSPGPAWSSQRSRWRSVVIGATRPCSRSCQLSHPPPLQRPARFIGGHPLTREERLG